MSIDIRACRQTCQVCKQSKPNTKSRRVRNKNYQGPCGDSFCYASCDNDSCVTSEFTIQACDGCAKKL